MSKTKLNVAYQFDFELYGVIAPIKDYKMAWLVNQGLGVNLVKIKDLKLEFVDGKSLNLAHYEFKREFSSLKLVRNKSYQQAGTAAGYLLPELPNFDFFILMSGFESTLGKNDTLRKKLREIDKVQFVQHIDIQTLKSRENLIF